jgi:hypothetical protein
MDRRLSVILLTAVFVGGLGSYLTWRELHRHAGAGEGPAIATLERKERQVRRKLAHRYAWFLAIPGETYHHREALQTSSKAHALLSLTAGGKLQVGPDSLLLFDAYEPWGLQLLEGSAELLQPGHETIALRPGVRPPPKSHEVPKPLAFNGSEPRDGETYFVLPGSERHVTFSWEKAQAGDRLEISSSEEFLSRVSGVSSDAPGRAVAELGPGKWFWRIESAESKPRPNGESRKGGVRQFRILEAQPLRPVFGGRLGSGARFTFIEPAGLPDLHEGVHWIEISGSEDFVVSSRLNIDDPDAGSVETSALPGHSIWWRIASLWSDVTVRSPVLRLEALPDITRALGASGRSAGREAASRSASTESVSAVSQVLDGQSTGKGRPGGEADTPKRLFAESCG